MKAKSTWGGWVGIVKAKSTCGEVIGRLCAVLAPSKAMATPNSKSSRLRLICYNYHIFYILIRLFRRLTTPRSAMPFLESEVRSRSQESAVRSQEPGARSQESGRPHWKAALLFCNSHPLPSSLDDPFSDVQQGQIHHPITSSGRRHEWRHLIAK